MALGGALSVMNTQFAAVHQRAKDIGVLRVLGYTRPQLLMSFLLESLAIALLGGSAGCALGFLANGLSAAGTLAGDQGVKDVVLELVVDGKTITVALLFALVMLATSTSPDGSSSDVTAAVSRWLADSSLPPRLRLSPAIFRLNGSVR